MINYKTIGEELTHIHDLTKQEANEVVKSVFTLIGSHLAAGEEVHIKEFGSFRPAKGYYRKYYSVNNEKMSYSYVLPKPAYRPSSKLRERMNNNPNLANQSN